ncbi:DNA cytosine methyltransferase (plasmid) [Halorubrum sp. BOL3-1]|uniref:DNA cytosine methyltransferase n=1 Tax=Halorubrum sp. BOL3-1 TaxID=2497325 RepID=UPI0010050C7D|nr:DNA cytosine methyltransferase [Halorubrum sp. BOL3-1]QAU14546.1 DNA cytosine methyltransferase [Halorubrum sp. BOL3-1]
MATNSADTNSQSSINKTGPAASLFETIEAGEKINVVDLFAGAGGMSSGAIRVLSRIADEVDEPVEEIAEVIAVNHWSCAIDTHNENYPWATHFHSKIQELRPRDIIKDERTGLESSDTIHLLIGCPDCTYFSSARGGGPKDPDSRATPREILDWVERLDVRNLLFENVPEFRSWGPLDDNNEVIDGKKGEYFDNWINALNIEGFAVDWKILNAADYGDATSRRRLFVAGRKDSGVSWPKQTHSEDGSVPGTQEWRTAADIIDWSDPGESIWSRDLEDGRRKPLKNTTMQRIAEGVRRHGSEMLEPFADALANIGRDEVFEMRENIVPAADAELVAQSVSDPFLVKYYGTSSTRPVTESPDTVTSGGQKFALCTPYVLGQHGGAQAKPVTENPLPTVASRGAISKFTASPFVLPKNGKQRGLFSNKTYLEKPLHTIVAGRIDQGYSVTPYLVPFYGERSGQRPRTHDISEPHPTIPASAIKRGLIEPYLVEYYGNGTAQPVTGPLVSQHVAVSG